jgi:hypothetical protein
MPVKERVCCVERNPGKVAQGTVLIYGGGQLVKDGEKEREFPPLAK